MTLAPVNLPPAHRARTPLGSIEPHSGLLEMPPEGQLLYKVMRPENRLGTPVSRGETLTDMGTAMYAFIPSIERCDPLAAEAECAEHG